MWNTSSYPELSVWILALDGTLGVQGMAQEPLVRRCANKQGTECSWVKERGVNKQSQRQRADQQSAGAGAGGERGRVRLCETHCVLVVVRSRASSAAARGKSAIVALEN